MVAMSGDDVGMGTASAVMMQGRGQDCASLRGWGWASVLRERGGMGLTSLCSARMGTDSESRTTLYSGVTEKPDAVNGENKGSKCGGWYQMTLDPDSSAIVRCRLRLSQSNLSGSFGKPFDDIFALRIKEANAFYNSVRSH